MDDIDGYRFFFCGNESDEPAHVIVGKGGAEAKFDLNLPVRLREQCGFKSQDVRRVRRLVEQHKETLLRAWHDRSRN